MSLDKSRIPKLSDSSRKYIPEIHSRKYKQKKAMNDIFVERITRTRIDKGKKILGIMVEACYIPLLAIVVWSLKEE